MVDKVLKYENLEVEFSNICRSLGLKAQLQKLNLSKPMNVQCSQDLIEEIKEFYAEDYRIYSQL